MKVVVNSRTNLTAKVGTRDPILVNQAAPVGARELNDLTDVVISNPADGDVLVYNEDTGVFITTRILEKQDINGGHF